MISCYKYLVCLFLRLLLIPYSGEIWRGLYFSDVANRKKSPNKIFTNIIKHDVIHNTRAPISADRGMSTCTTKPQDCREMPTCSSSTADSPHTFQKQCTSGWDLS